MREIANFDPLANGNGDTFKTANVLQNDADILAPHFNIDEWTATNSAELATANTSSVITTVNNMPTHNCANSNTSAKRAAPDAQRCPAGACACKQLHYAVAKRRRCCGDGCQCQSGQCTCPEHIVSTSGRCCEPQATPVVRNPVIPQRSVLSRTTTTAATRKPPQRATCVQMPSTVTTARSAASTSSTALESEIEALTSMKLTPELPLLVSSPPTAHNLPSETASQPQPQPQPHSQHHTPNAPPLVNANGTHPDACTNGITVPTAARSVPSELSTLENSISMHKPSSPSVTTIKTEVTDAASNSAAHIEQSLQSATLECSDCTKTFESQRLLESHGARVHRKSRPYKCSQCSSTFLFKQNRDRHVVEVHLGKRPHACPHEQCTAAFKNSSGLKQHIRTVHDRERPFKCDRCESSFGQRNHLTQHILVVHDRMKLFRCAICDTSFSNRGNLNQHCKRKHAGAAAPQAPEATPDEGQQ